MRFSVHKCYLSDTVHPCDNVFDISGVCSVNLLSANTTLTSQITASNTKVNSSMLVSYLPEKAILYAQEETSISQTRFMGGWSPQVSDLNQWIQVKHYYNTCSSKKMKIKSQKEYQTVGTAPKSNRSIVKKKEVKSIP